jgi:thiamine-monophosphate kinase
VGEHAWIARLTRRLAAAPPAPAIVVGPGDDAAAVRPGRRPWLLTTDTLVEGVHFRRGWISPRALGRRAFAINASDVAAMGGVPRLALLALEAPGRMAAADVDALVAGFDAAARRGGARLVGGNLAAGPHLAITVALAGVATGRIVTRAGARPGDVLHVTGTVGGAGLALRDLRAGRRTSLPAVPVRVRAAPLLARVAHAMIDVSDGLLQDLEHVCRASNVAAEVVAGRLPLAPRCRVRLGHRAAAFAATAGEDYELLVAVPPARTLSLARLAPRLGCRLTQIGRIVSGRPGARLLDEAGRAIRVGRRGFDHFRRRG